MYLSAHGFGHAVRAAAVLSRLRDLAPVRLTVLAACDRRIWPDDLRPHTDAWLEEPCDAGVVQSDDVTVDPASTSDRLKVWLAELPAIVEREAARLAGGYDLVLGDVPSPAFAAAERARIPGVAIANFTWDWIYEELGFPAAAAAAARDYSRASLLLQATPYAPMTAFGRRVDVGLVARAPSRSRPSARRMFAGSAADQIDSVVLLAFQPGFASSVVLPPPAAGRTYLAPALWPEQAGRADVRVLPAGSGFADALAAADVVVGKPGYGLISDVEAAGARFLYVPRPGFPENAVLERHLASRSGTRSVPAAALASGEWLAELEAIESDARPVAARADGAVRAAAAIAELVGIDSDRRAV